MARSPRGLDAAPQDADRVLRAPPRAESELKLGQAALCSTVHQALLDEGREYFAPEAQQAYGPVVLWQFSVVCLRNQHALKNSAM
eukprot:4370788-Pyramimonas_sp.AAC.1